MYGWIRFQRLSARMRRITVSLVPRGKVCELTMIDLGKNLFVDGHRVMSTHGP
jgi:hypothetical protein